MADSVQLEEISYRHEAIIDWMLLNPDKKQSECAKALNYTEAWLSSVVNSDLFKYHYAQRRMAYNRKLHDGIVTKLAETSKESLEKLHDYVSQMEVGGEEFDPHLLLDIADRTLHRQGYAPTKHPMQVVPEGNNGQKHEVDKDLLEQSRNLMRQREKLQAIDVEVKVVENDPNGSDK